MARYTGPKHKLARREGVNILEKDSRALDRRLNILPGVHGRKRRKKLSEYGIELREKQKLKRIYGILERQFKKYVALAQKKRGDTAESLIQQLETRLDNIVYRLGFAKSRQQARQFVSHRHILINGKRVNIPSYNVRGGDVVSLSEKLFKNEVNQEMLKEKGNILPFLERTGNLGKLVRLPGLSDVQNPVDYQLVIEFYSR